MNFWGHYFRDHKGSECMCSTCGYIVPFGLSETETKKWITTEELCEVWCGGRWHSWIRPHFAPADEPLSKKGEDSVAAVLQAVVKRFGPDINGPTTKG